MKQFGPAFSKLAMMATALTLLMLLAACGGGSSRTEAPATETTVSELSSGEILARASQQLAETKSLKFNLAIQGETYVDTNDQIQLLSASGILIRPDRVFTEFRVKIAKSVTVSMQLITIGNKHWSTDLITGKWGPAPEEFGYTPSILFDNQNGIGPVMNTITGATRLANDTVPGRETYHIQATVNQDIIGPLTSESMQGDNVGVDLWIDVKTFNLLQVRLTESKDVTGHVPAVWDLSLTSQDANLAIEAPNATPSVSTPVAAGSPIASPAPSPAATPGAGA